jgi:hypothetical protein
MISTQLRKSAFARIFFNGIAVARNSGEGDRAANRAALASCVELLQKAGELFVFPEGTSSLGPKHLPFKAGAVQLILDWRAHDGGPLHVVPLGVHYECAWAFRSRVEVVAGAPIDITLPVGLPELARLRELRRRVTQALENVGVNFPDAAAQRDAEALATISALEARQPRFLTLKAFESEAPAISVEAWRALDAAASEGGAWRWHGVPIVPGARGIVALLELALLGPLVVAGILLNAPPWIAAAWAARKFADDKNVISLWKILVGVPAFGGWLVVAAITCRAAGTWCGFSIYAALTLTAWLGYDRLKRLAVSANNGLRHRALRPKYNAVATALREMSLR